MRLSLWGALGGLACLSLTTAARGGPALLNGGFESPKTTTGGFTNFSDGDDIGGWEAVGSVSVADTNFTQNGISFVAEEGSQWLDLTGFNANSAEGVEQTVATAPGAQYNLNFWVGNVVNPNGLFGTDSTVEVFIDGVALPSATNSDGAGSTTQNWKEFSRLFTATGSSTLIRFLNADPAGDNSNGLDNVSLTQVGGPPAAVPLPSALAQTATLGAALGGAFAFTRLRRRVAHG